MPCLPCQVCQRLATYTGSVAARTPGPFLRRRHRWHRLLQRERELRHSEGLPAVLGTQSVWCSRRGPIPEWVRTPLGVLLGSAEFLPRHQRPISCHAISAVQPVLWSKGADGSRVMICGALNPRSARLAEKVDTAEHFRYIMATGCRMCSDRMINRFGQTSISMGARP